MAGQDEDLLEQDRIGPGDRMAASNNGSTAREEFAMDPELQNEVEEGLSSIGRDLRAYIDKTFAERAGAAETAAFGDSGSFEHASIRGAIFGALVLALGVWLGGRARK